MNIELKLKTYDELIFEITTLNTNNYLLQEKVKQLDKENKELNRMCEIYSQSLYNADLKKAEQDVDRLNNIINELENDLKKRKHTYTNMNGSINGVAVGCFTYVLKKLQELKENK